METSRWFERLPRRTRCAVTLLNVDRRFAERYCGRYYGRVDVPWGTYQVHAFTKRGRARKLDRLVDSLLTDPRFQQETTP